MIMFTLTLTILCILSSLTQASPLSPRIVFNPNITVPNASTVWEVGTTQTVKWDITGLPDETLTGMVVLGHIEPDDPINEHLVLKPPLAQGFLLKNGEIAVTIPDVPSRPDYIVVVFGDSGNASPKFSINNPNNSGKSTITSSSSAASSLPQTTFTDPIPITGTTITGSPPSDPSTIVTSVSSSSNSTPSTRTAPATPTLPTSATNGASGGTATTSSTVASGTSADSTSGSNDAGRITSSQPFATIAFIVALSLIL